MEIAREQMGDEELIQAASQVQAKLKMFSAYEEELTGRAGGRIRIGPAARHVLDDVEIHAARVLGEHGKYRREQDCRAKHDASQIT